MAGVPPSPPDFTDLTQAHGEVRDALSALKGFSTLLRSTKVGPRTIEGALDDVLMGCKRLSQAIAEATGLIEAALGTGCTGDLRHTAEGHCSTLHAKAQAARPMNAARRIDLEHTTLQALAELEACLMLVELLTEAATSSTTSVDLVSLLGPGRGSDPELHPTKRTVLARCSFELSQREFQLKPRVAVLVIANSVAFVTQDKHPRCCLHISDAPEGGFAIEISRRSEVPERLSREIEIVVPRILPASETCCKTAARSSIAELTWEHDPPRALLRWSAH